MVSSSSLLLAITAAVGALAAPSGKDLESSAPGELLNKRTAAGQGTNNGYFYSYWTDGTGTVSYTNDAAGEYTTSWTDCGDFTAGKGWNPGSAQYVPTTLPYPPAPFH